MKHNKYSIPDLIRDPFLRGFFWIPAFAGMLIAFGPAFAQAEVPAVCRMLAGYKPTSVAYEPGVDVHGKKVVPADLSSSPIELPDKMKVPLTFDLIEKLKKQVGYHSILDGTEAELNLGVLEITRQGDVYYNGQDWSRDVRAVCGQPASNAIRSQDVPVDGQKQEGQLITK